MFRLLLNLSVLELLMSQLALMAKKKKATKKRKTAKKKGRGAWRFGC